MPAMMILAWVLVTARLVFTAADLQRKSVSPMPVVELESKQERTQTINTAPITIHIPIPNLHTTHETSGSDTPAAIATEAPEGTYILPVTENSKQKSPPTVNLVLNLRLIMDIEKKREQPDALTVVSGGTPKPELKTYPAEYVAHEVKVLAPNANLDSVSTQEGTSTSPTSELSAGVLQAHSHATELTKFRQEILGAHNFKRQLHKVPLLTEDVKLDKQAQSFAVKLAIQGNITHSPLRDRIGQGENIALRCALKAPISVLTGRRATNLWYNESKKFNWSIKALTPATQRFTQMVWKNTSKAGFGRAKFVEKDGKTCFVVVARYAPAGNEKGKLMDNVFRSNNGTMFKPNVPRGTPM
ncbi:uncharacterized protein [Montipora capricornis]|uniref:uncharacterized protein n=1 Tax=Montipora capricornis TaxID=246305 RepID=UPI0035F12CD6